MANYINSPKVYLQLSLQRLGYKFSSFKTGGFLLQLLNSIWIKSRLSWGGLVRLFKAQLKRYNTDINWSLSNFTEQSSPDDAYNCKKKCLHNKRVSQKYSKHFIQVVVKSLFMFTYEEVAKVHKSGHIPAHLKILNVFSRSSCSVQMNQNLPSHTLEHLRMWCDVPPPLHYRQGNFTLKYFFDDVKAFTFWNDHLDAIL